MSKATKDLTIVTSIIMSGGPRGVAEQRIVQNKLQGLTARIKALEANEDTKADADVNNLALARAESLIQDQAKDLRSLQPAHDTLEEEVGKLTRELAAAKKTHKKKHTTRRTTKTKVVKNETED